MAEILNDPRTMLVAIIVSAFIHGLALGILFGSGRWRYPKPSKPTGSN